VNSHTDSRNQPGSFDPVGFTVVPGQRFEDLRVGEVFRAASRALTDAPAAAFQIVLPRPIGWIKRAHGAD